MNQKSEWDLEGMIPSHIPFGELQGSIQKQRDAQRTISLKCTTPLQYLSSVEPYIPKQLISSQNFTEIKTLASQLPGKITSFFGFETRLNTLDGRADYLFAVSSKKGEREALLDLIQKKKLPETFLKQLEWQRVGKFVQTWADPASELHSKILGLWLEFDTAYSSSSTPIPCVFIHTVPLRMKSNEEEQNYDWLFHTAIPLLLGQPLSPQIHQKLITALANIPLGASVMDVGFMLSRSAAGARLVFKHLQPNQIIPYLQSLGWCDTNNEFAGLIEELEQKVTRLILHITITENGVDSKIGLECSYSPDQYHLETRWVSFFEYLQEKKVCLPHKTSVLLGFLGVECDNPSDTFSFDSYQAMVRLSDEPIKKAAVRYISHVKLVYKPNQPLEAKAYLGVRLFGCQSTERNADVC